MAGLQKYNKREIVFVMYRMINKMKNDEIVKQFHAEFGRPEFDETQVRYMGNKYGDDVKYGSLKKNFNGAVAGECPQKYVEMAIARGSKAETSWSAKRKRASTKTTIAALYAKAIPTFRRLKESQKVNQTCTLSSPTPRPPAPMPFPGPSPAGEHFKSAPVPSMHEMLFEDVPIHNSRPLPEFLDVPVTALEPVPYSKLAPVPNCPDPLTDLYETPASDCKQATYTELFQLPVVSTDVFMPGNVECDPQAWKTPTAHHQQLIPWLPTIHQPLDPQPPDYFGNEEKFLALPQPDFVDLTAPDITWAQTDFADDHAGNDFDFDFDFDLDIPPRGESYPLFGEDGTPYT